METVILLVFLVILSIEDIRWKEVHSMILYAFLASGIVVWFIKGQVSFYEFAGGIVCGMVLYIFSMAMPERLGSADGIVLASTGAFLGLTQNLALIVISTIYAGAGSLFAVTVMRRDRDETLPLIPFIAAGCVTLAIIKERQ